MIKNYILSVLVATLGFADEIYFIDGIDDLDIVAREGWVFVEDSAFVDLNITKEYSDTKVSQPSVELYGSSEKSGCGGTLFAKKKDGCKSSR